MGRVDRPGIQGIRVLTAAAELSQFVRANSTVAAPPLCPEVRLHLAAQLTPVWEVLERRSGGNEVPPPYWACAWPGGQALARHVLDNPQLVAGKRVLDFASGGGIAAIAAALSGAAEVLAADIDPIAVAAMRLNAALNGTTFAITAEDLTQRADQRWDVILAGDVCYEYPMAEGVLAWLRGRFEDGALVLLADPGRKYVPLRGVTSLATYNVPTTRDQEAGDARRTTVYRLS